MPESGGGLFADQPRDGESLRRAIAAFVLANQDAIRATARRKLAAGVRAACDSDDILSSVLRRLDNLARRGRLQIGTERELWGLIHTIAANTSLGKAKLIERTRSLADEDPEGLACLTQEFNACEDDDDAALLVYRMAMSLSEAEDRQVLFARLRGASLRAVAGMLGVSDQAARKRWSRVCARLRGSFGREA